MDGEMFELSKKIYCEWKSLGYGDVTWVCCANWNDAAVKEIIISCSVISLEKK